MSKNMRLYHGTSKKFDRFENAMFCTGNDTSGFSDLGHFFTPDYDLAELFAGRNGHVIEVEVEMKKTIEMSISQILRWSDTDGGVVVAVDITELRSDLIDRGYDSAVILPATDDEDEALGLGGEFSNPQYVVFDASQITIII